MNLGELRAYVREYLDVEEEELSDTLLDSYIKDGYKRILRREQRWPWLEHDWQFFTAPDQTSYPLTGFGDDVDEVLSVVIPGERPLRWIGHDQAVTTYDVGLTNGTPMEWSTWNGELFLWPTATTTQEFTVRGYRTPSDWTSYGAGAVPECPDEYHLLLARWAIACEYERQEDTEMAAYNRQHFDDELTTLHKSAMRMPPPSPIVMGGGRRPTATYGQPMPVIR